MKDETRAGARADFQRLAAAFPEPLRAPADAPLAAGGDLAPQRLLAAYSRGIFPWYEAGLPILWWSPDPRCVLPPERFCLPRRSVRALRGRPFRLTVDAAFGEVIRACAAPRGSAHGHGGHDGHGAGTWITPQMLAAYERLHALGYAHSVEAWRDGRLAGGLYGVGLGRAFFGESMFHREAEASRAALAGLVSLLRLRGAALLDCQQATPHMERMGACLMRRKDFLAALSAALADAPGRPGDGDNALCPWPPWRERYAFLGWSRQRPQPVAEAQPVAEVQPDAEAQPDGAAQAAGASGLWAVWAERS